MQNTRNLENDNQHPTRRSFLQCPDCFKLFRNSRAKSNHNCISSSLPFSLQAKDTLFSNLTPPSFTIQTLLDKMPGNRDEQTDDFLSDTILSKYYSSSEFLKAKFPKHPFSMFHLNIASLSAHFDELKTLLTVLNHPFDVIGISETRIKEGFDPLIDVTLDGYDFVQTPTKTRCGGTGFYIRNEYEYEVLKEFSKSEENICESIFIELKRHNKKNLIVGCIYRHHSSPELFIDNFLKKNC